MTNIAQYARTWRNIRKRRPHRHRTATSIPITQDQDQETSQIEKRELNPNNSVNIRNEEHSRPNKPNPP